MLHPPKNIKVGDQVKDSPYGPCVITGFSEGQYPMAGTMLLTWCILENGQTFDPHFLKTKKKPYGLK